MDLARLASGCGLLVLSLALGCAQPSNSEKAPDAAPSCEALTAAPAPLRLLTRVQYDNTVLDLLGDDTRPAALFPPEHQLLGFDNNAEAHRVSPLLVESYMHAAEALAERAIGTRLEALAPCSSPSQAQACGEAFIQSFGLRAFRRPLTGGEAASFGRLWSATHAAAGYAQATRAVLEAMLQSPQFLYRIDVFGAATPETGAVALGPYELASRLSYLYWNTMPDDELLAAAAEDRLTTPEQLRAQAERLLASPRARAMVSDFHRQWLGLDAFAGLVREDPALAEPDVTLADLRRSLERFVDFVFWEDGANFGSLLTSPVVFVNDRLAPLFGVAPPGTSELEPTQVPETRAGLLTQPALLTLLAHPTQSSPIQRGVYVRERVLCDPLDPPPPTVDQTPPDPDPKATTRERFREHTEQPACAGCHAKIDPIGFGFENYDQFGRYRSDEHGLTIDARGEIEGLADPELQGPYEGAAELTAKLAASQRARDCYSTHWYRYAMGRAETDADSCSLGQLRASFAASGGDMKTLLVNLALTDAFRFRPAVEAP